MPGVSRKNGTPARRGWPSRWRSPWGPMLPPPMCWWRSRCEPQAALESLRWIMARRRAGGRPCSPPADVLVAVEMRAAGGLGVVEVDHGQASCGEASVELLEEGVEDLRAAGLVAGPPEVRGVEAEGDALRVGAGDRDGLQDRLQLVDRRTHAVPATGRVLQHQQRRTDPPRTATWGRARLTGWGACVASGVMPGAARRARNAPSSAGGSLRRRQ